MKAHRYLTAIEQAQLSCASGTLTRIGSEYLEADGPLAGVGDYCEIALGHGEAPALAEVVAVDHTGIRLLPFAGVRRLRLGTPVSASRHAEAVPVGDRFGGRVIDALARPLDKGWTCNGFVPVTYLIMPPLFRTREG